MLRQASRKFHLPSGQPAVPPQEHGHSLRNPRGRAPHSALPNGAFHGHCRRDIHRQGDTSACRPLRLRCCDLAVPVMGEDAFSGKTSLRSSYRKRNFGTEHADVLSHGGAERGNNRLGVVGAVIHHRQQNAVNLQSWIDLPLDL